MGPILRTLSSPTAPNLGPLLSIPSNIDRGYVLSGARCARKDFTNFRSGAFLFSGNDQANMKYSKRQLIFRTRVTYFPETAKRELNTSKNGIINGEGGNSSPALDRGEKYQRLQRRLRRPMVQRK